MSADSSENMDPAVALKAETDQQIMRLMRQSNKFRNPRRLRRADTKTGKPRSPDWTVQEEALLGKVSDAEAAKRLGRTRIAVCVHRGRLGIPNYRPMRRWTHEELALVGTMPDRLLARKLHRTVISVVGKRTQLGLPNMIEGYHRWRPEDDVLLGQRTDR